VALACDMYGEGVAGRDAIMRRGSRSDTRLHGALDPHVPMAQVTEFVDEMTHVGADYQVIIYGTAMHGFTHETATGSSRVSATTRRRTADRALPSRHLCARRSRRSARRRPTGVGGMPLLIAV
jgi:dienelactone hydrolase